MSRRVTTPNEGERPLAKWERAGMVITHLPDDPICPRVSLGGVDDAAYLVFRGDPAAITALLRRALTAMESP